ncbi:MAG: DUF86 domain-containing protein [Deltaproteobacteria bacterium]|nr:DUF86 domain-containing protein [Deltaproteobacteria bacterium]
MRALKRQSIVPRIDGITRDLQRLRELSRHSLDEFSRRGDIFALAQFYLRQTLEGVFHIGSHILSRLPGGRATEYKEIARLLGEQNVVPITFAQQSLIPMAGYRTRLTHFYYEVGPQEILDILQKRLGEIEQFLDDVRDLLQDPTRLHLTIE